MGEAALPANGAMEDGGEDALDGVGGANALPVPGREVVEGEQRLLVLGQATNGLPVSGLDVWGRRCRAPPRGSRLSRSGGGPASRAGVPSGGRHPGPTQPCTRRAGSEPRRQHRAQLWGETFSVRRQVALHCWQRPFRSAQLGKETGARSRPGRPAERTPGLREPTRTDRPAGADCHRPSGTGAVVRAKANTCRRAARGSRWPRERDVVPNQTCHPFRCPGENGGAKRGRASHSPVDESISSPGRRTGRPSRRPRSRIARKVQREPRSRDLEAFLHPRGVSVDSVPAQGYIPVP